MDLPKAIEFVFASVSENFVNALITALSYLDNTCVNNSVGHAQLCIPPHNFLNPCGGIMQFFTLDSSKIEVFETYFVDIAIT